MCLSQKEAVLISVLCTAVLLLPVPPAFQDEQERGAPGGSWPWEHLKAAQGSLYPFQDPAHAQGMCNPFPGRKAGASSQVLVVLPQGQLQVLPVGTVSLVNSL